MKIPLVGVWKIQDKSKIDSNPVLFDHDDRSWENIGVPSHWQMHPKFQYYPENVVYRRKFSLDKKYQGKIIILRFDGVFYFCNVYLNEKFLGEHRGYFAPFEFDVTDIVDFDDENLLVVDVSCPVEKTYHRKKMITGIFSHWDCKSPNIHPGGIWQNVYLVVKEDIYFKRCEFETMSVTQELAKVSLTACIVSKSRKEAKLSYAILPFNFEGKIKEGNFNLQLTEGENIFLEKIDIENPALWWTYDTGYPHLYQVEMKVLDKDRVVDSFSYVTGIRKIEMKKWIFYLNGKRIFLKGTNYAPADIRLSEANLELYQGDVKMMKDANMNIVRVHAHVEKQELYDVLDREGLLCWQDFPLQWCYSKEIEKDAIAQMKEMTTLLKHHPSIAIWCCHNEPFYVPGGSTQINFMQAAKILFSMFGWNWNKNVLDKKLEKVAKKEDKTRPVIRASGVVGYLLGKIGATDSHLYFGWYIGKIKHLDFFSKITFNNFSKFVTEFGAQAFPNKDNFSKIMEGELQDIDWEILSKEYLLQFELMEKKSTKRSEHENLSSYILSTQKYQSELNKYYIEYFRKLKYKPCGGILHFMFSDCCPAITWSVVDYWRTPKLSYSTIAKCFLPLYIMMDTPRKNYKNNEMLEENLYVINDYHNRFENVLVMWNIVDSQGRVLKEEKMTLDIEEDSILKIGRINFKIENLKGKVSINLKLVANNFKEVENSYHFEVI